MNDIKFSAYTINDIGWTLANFIPELYDNEKLRYQAANAALIVAKIGFGDCYLISDFIEQVKDLSLMDYDGQGEWVDNQGDSLGSIRCDVKWLEENQPDSAAFIMWYNK